MSRDTERVIGVAQSVIDGIRSEQITFLAASLAYYAFVSLIPLLLLAIVVGTTVGGAGFAGAVSEPVTAAIGGEAGEVVRDALKRQSGGGGATIVGLLVLLWSGLKLFRGIDIAFSTVYTAPSPPGFVGQLRNALLTLSAVAIGIALTVAIGAGIAVAPLTFVIGGVNVLGTIGTIAQLGGLMVSLLPIYYILPSVPVSVREALPGAAFTAVGWTVLQTAFRIYTGYASGYAAYGVLGAVLLLVTFLYFGGLILLVGVVINATLAGRLDSETDDPDGDDHGGTKTETTT